MTELFLEIIVKFVSLVSSIFDFCVDVPMEKFDCDFESKSLKEDDDDDNDEDDEQGDSNLIV